MTLRVIAGELRGRRLRAPDDRATRPTSDRAREGLFAWLGPLEEGGAVLDLFAGTGALGIEALSRGAGTAVFVESHRRVLTTLESNLGELGLRDRTRIVRRDVARLLRDLRGNASRRPEVEALGGPFALVFADPPYATDWPARLVQSPVVLHLLARDGRLVIERDRAGTRKPEERRRPPGARAPAPEVGSGTAGSDETASVSGGALCTPGLVLRESREYGRTAFDWYERGAAASQRGVE